MNKLFFECLTESVSLDNIDSSSSAVLEQKIDDMLKDVYPISDDIKVTVENVRIIKDEEGYYINFHEAKDLAKELNVSILEALETLADYHNNNGADLRADNFFVTIESENVFQNMIKNAKYASKELIHMMESYIDDINALKEKGVTIKTSKK